MKIVPAEEFKDVSIIYFVSLETGLEPVTTTKLSLYLNQSL